jgi:hypothetical protein
LGLGSWVIGEGPLEIDFANTIHINKPSQYFVIPAKKMNTSEKLNLKKMLANSNEYVDHTEEIRRVKHSGLLLDGLRDIEKLKRANKELREADPAAFEDMCRTTAPLMYDLYRDLFRKLVKDEINLVILVKLIRVLELIEQGQVDQNEGSVMVGKVLKDLYVDSAMREGDRLDKERLEKELLETGQETQGTKKEPAKNISWRQWKTSEINV